MHESALSRSPSLKMQIAPGSSRRPLRRKAAHIPFFFAIGTFEDHLPFGNVTFAACGILASSTGSL
jgi:hypothetical protein